MDAKDSRLIVITGGARSGKSSFAEAMAREVAGDAVACVVTLDTSQNDAEMMARVERHRARRSAAWRTVEAPFDLCAALAAVTEATVLVDCLTVWLANRLDELSEASEGAEEIATGWIDEVAAAVRKRSGTTIVVTNEVGSGLVPLTPVGRRFRDVAGRANQRLADAADEVWLVVAGQPLRLKPHENAPSWWTGRNRF